MDYQRLFSEIDSLSDKYVGILEDLCNIESPSSYKAGVDAVGSYIINYMKQFGFSVVVHEEKVSGNAICIKMNEDVMAAPICFSGHMDTVHPIGAFGTPAVRFDDESVPFSERKIYGPGVLDCKGGIVGSMMAMEALNNIGYKKRPIYLILQSDEEVGSSYSEKRTVQFMAQMAKDAVAFLNAEGCPNKFVIERKGIVTYELEISGLAVHSSLCYEGVNAVAEAAHKILELERYKDKDGITCNCSMISGGTTVNTVPDKCSFKVNIRFLTDEDFRTAKELVQRVADTSYIKGSSCTVKQVTYRVNMPIYEQTLSLYNKIDGILADAGLERFPQGRSNGGSDAADMARCGIPSIDSFGVKGAWLHSVKEYAYISTLSDCAKRLGAVSLAL